MEWLNYHHLHYFWTVARVGSIRKASEELRVSPPAISAQLRTLEEGFGAKLFQRSGRSLVLTETGQIVFSYGEEIFTLGRELITAVKDRSSGWTLEEPRRGLLSGSKLGPELALRARSSKGKRHLSAAAIARIRAGQNR
jgi:DNA-binding transcriptional LysR family regulator